MPTLLRKRGIRFYIHDHETLEPPHVHADNGNGTVTIWLFRPFAGRSRRLSSEEIAEISSIVRDHRAQLLGAWHDYYGVRTGREDQVRQL